MPVHVGGVDVMENYNERPPAGGEQIVVGRGGHPPWEPQSSQVRERVFFIDNLLVRIH